MGGKNIDQTTGSIETKVDGCLHFGDNQVINLYIKNIKYNSTIATTLNYDNNFILKEKNLKDNLGILLISLSQIHQ